MTALRRAASACLRWGAVAAVTVALVLGGSTVAPASASTASDVNAPIAVENRPRLSLTPDRAGTLDPNGALAGTLTIRAGTDEPLAEGSATVFLGSATLADSAALNGWLSGSPINQVWRTVETVPTPALAIGTPTQVPLTGSALTGQAPGVYPVRLVLRSGTTEVEARTIITVAAASSLQVGLIVPITAAPRTTGLLTRDELAELTGPDGNLTALLAATAGTGAVLAVDPAIPAAIRALGDGAPASATEWLDRLLAAGNDRFPLQFGDADVAAQLRSGIRRPLQPTSLNAYLDTDAGAPTDLATLLDIGTSTTGIDWPAKETVDGAVVAVQAGRGGLTVLPSTATTPGANGAAVRSRVDGALVYDAEASHLLTKGLVTDETQSKDLATATAETWLTAARTGAPALLALDRLSALDGTPPDAAGILAAVRTITADPAVRMMPLRELLRQPAPAVDIPPGAVDVDAANAVTLLTRRDAAVAHTALALSDPTLLTGTARAETLQLLAVGWRDLPPTWADALDAEDQRIQGWTTAVLVQVSEQVQLLGSEAPLPVWVENRLPWPITARLQVRSNDIRLAVEEFIDVQVPAGSKPRVAIPVTARLGSGDVDLTLSLLATTGQQLTAPQTMHVTVRAEWERIGIGVLGGIVLLLFVGGVWRTVRRRRARADAQDLPAEGADG